MKILLIGLLVVSSLLLAAQTNNNEQTPVLLAYRMSLEMRLFALPQAQYTKEVRGTILEVCKRLSDLEGNLYTPLYIEPHHQGDSFDLRWVHIDEHFHFDEFLKARNSHLHFIVALMQAKERVEFEIEDEEDDWLYLHVTPTVSGR